MIESTHEFIKIVRTVTNPKMIASLDVEALFTNVPLQETLNIIINSVYSHPTKKPPPIQPDTLRELLSICTTKTPFRSTTGDLYQQIDGVSMGTPLGPTIANYYMSYLENSIFTNTPSMKPYIYCRYIDDIFLAINNVDQLFQLKQTFKENSVLNFTFEIEDAKKLPFLDTIITRIPNKLSTTVYRKATNTGECLNYNSICPERYKISVIQNFLHRAYLICSDWEEFSVEVKRIKQLLINNNFPNYIVDKTTSKFMNNKMKREHEETTGEDTTGCLLYTSPSPRDKRQSRMPSSA